MLCLVNGLLIQSILHGFHPHRSVRNVRGEIFHVGAGGVSLKNAWRKIWRERENLKRVFLLSYKSDSKIDLQRYQLFLLSFTNTEQSVVVFAIPFH